MIKSDYIYLTPTFIHRSQIGTKHLRFDAINMQDMLKFISHRNNLYNYVPGNILTLKSGTKIYMKKAWMK